MARTSQSEHTIPIPHEVVRELLGRGLSYKQWSLILTGELFNDWFGGRYFTEWQHALGCQSFMFDNAIKQMLVDCELEMFRSEILGMVEQGYTFKCIVRRLSGRVWRSGGTDEQAQRLGMRRLLGGNVRSRTLRLASKRWTLELASTKSIKESTFQPYATHIKHLPFLYNHTSQYPTDNQIPVRPIRTPEYLTTTTIPSLQTCRYSSSPKHAPIPPNQAQAKASRKNQPNHAITDLNLANQHRTQILCPMEADLHHIKAALHEQEREIALLQLLPVYIHKPLPPLAFLDGFEGTSSHYDLEKENRYRSRRRGRLFYCNKRFASPRPVKVMRSRIPVKIVLVKPGAALHVGVGVGVVVEKRDDRDSGYASPSSPCGSNDGILPARTYSGGQE